MKERKAFTLTEVLVAVAIMSIMAGVMALNSTTVGQQSAKREAERVAAFIQGHISRENIARRGLWFQVKENSIKVWHGFDDLSKELQTPEFKANSGCTYTSSTSKFYYHIKQSSFASDWILIADDSTVITDSGTNGQHIITVEGADKKSLNVIIGRKP